MKGAEQELAPVGTQNRQDKRMAWFRGGEERCWSRCRFDVAAGLTISGWIRRAALEGRLLNPAHAYP